MDRWFINQSDDGMFRISIALFFKNIENHPEWIGHYIKGKETILLTVQEPLTEKPNSFKTLAKAESLLKNGEWQKIKGNVLIYVKKDSMPPALQYGSQIIITKNITTHYQFRKTPVHLIINLFVHHRTFITRPTFS